MLPGATVATVTSNQTVIDMVLKYHVLSAYRCSDHRPHSLTHFLLLLHAACNDSGGVREHANSKQRVGMLLLRADSRRRLAALTLMRRSASYVTAPSGSLTTAAAGAPALSVSGTTITAAGNTAMITTVRSRLLLLLLRARLMSP